MNVHDRYCLSLTAEDIESKIKNGERHTIRMKIPDGVTEFTDMVAGTVSFRNTGIDDQILIKSDGFPTYHLANVVDDHLMNIRYLSYHISYIWIIIK